MGASPRNREARLVVAAAAAVENGADSPPPLPRLISALAAINRGLTPSLFYTSAGKSHDPCQLAWRVKEFGRLRALAPPFAPSSVSPVRAATPPAA
ncbi:MAG TPA: hypothetical protein VF278_03400, partial [Pirellulales bacterium]